MGYYYIALNFVLLFITALAVFCFFSVAMDAMWVGQSLIRGGVTQFKLLRENLKAFTEVYLMTKFIAAIYMINAIVWKDSPLGGNGATVNILVSGVLLTAIGVFFIAVPRLYVELKWFEYKLALAGADETEESFDDLRPRGSYAWRLTSSICSSSAHSSARSGVSTSIHLNGSAAVEHRLPGRRQVEGIDRAAHLAYFLQSHWIRYV